ncbi:MAG: YeeE/YedE family protein [Caldilineaceae bacterium]|nr:YeeE/YedE family protein [Caldilineaceae bacterium]
MTILLALAAGTVLGYLLERGDFCFHSTLRGLFRRPPQLDLVRAYLLTLLIAIPLVQGMIALGWITPWIAPWAWQANLAGGLIFGAGMVIAATCVTGIFYKLGHGMLGTLVGLATWSIGDLLAWRGPLNSLRIALNQNPVVTDGMSTTLLNLLGAPLGIGLLILLLAAAALFLWRSPRPQQGKYWSWLPLGLAVGLFTGFAWLLALAGGANYTFGTSRVPTTLFETLFNGGETGNLWIPVALIALLPGSFIAARLAGTFWARGETSGRYTQLAVGGLLMGVGAGISGGCNLGHSLVGVPLLSLGSITTTLAMLLGLFLTDRAAGLLDHLSPHLNRSATGATSPG